MLALKSVQGDEWSPHSPDLNPCDFFLWGYLKSKAHKPLPSNLDKLKGRIESECSIQPLDLIQRAVFLCFKGKGRPLLPLLQRQSN